MSEPAKMNVIPDDPIGNTWALPKGAIARFGKGARSRTSILGDVALSPCGNYFAAGTGSGLWWYDVSTMSPVSLWETERGLISAVDISSNGKLVATTNWDGDVKVFDIQSGECISKMKRDKSIHLPPTLIAFSPDNQRIAIPEEKHGKIEIFDTKSGECLCQLELDVRKEKYDSLSQLAFSPNSEILTAAWEIPVDSDGPNISLATHNPQTYLYHTENGKQIGKYNGGVFAFSPDSRFLAYVCTDGNNRNTKDIPCFISVLEIDSGERIVYFKRHDKPVTSITFSPCGRFLVSCDNGGTLRKRELSTGKEKKVYHYDKSSPKNWPQKLIRKIGKKNDSKKVAQKAYSIKTYYPPDGGLYSAVLPHGTEVVEVWDVESHEKVRTYERLIESIGHEWFSKYPELTIAHTLKNIEDRSDEQSYFESLQDATCYPEHLVFSSDGNKLASTGVLNAMILWDVENKKLHTTLVREGWIDCFTFLDNDTLLIVNRYNDNTIQVWELDQPYNLLGSFSTHDLRRPVVLDNTGKRIAMRSLTTSWEQILYIWNLESDEKIEINTGIKDYISSMVFPSDGNRLVTGRLNGIIQLWDFEMEKEIISKKISDTLRVLKISHCGNFIAAGIKKEISILDTEDLSLIRTFQQPEGESYPYSLAFSSCSKYLASGTWWEHGMEKMSIRLWDVATGENIHTFKGHNTDIQTLTFSPDGTLLASGSYDGTILLWDVKSILNT